MAKWKIIIPIIMFTILIGIVMACKEVYKPNEVVNIFDEVEESGLGAECNVTLYNETQELYTNKTMQMEDLKYNYSFGTNLSIGEYRARIECHKLCPYNANCTNLYLGECNFVIESDGRMEIAIMLVMVGMIAVFIVFTFFFAKHESSLTYFFLLGTFICTAISLNLGWQMARQNTFSYVGVILVAYRVSLWVTWLLFLYILIILTVRMFNFMKIRKQRELDKGGHIQDSFY